MFRVRGSFNVFGVGEDPVNMFKARRLDIGIISKRKSKNKFPNKAGGVPVWLDPLNIPSGRSSVCDFCGDPLQFLLQICAPIYRMKSTYHRMLFVFMCPSMACLLRDRDGQKIRHPERPSRSVKVFRCQLPRVNPFYSGRDPENDGSQSPAGSGAALCDWCGTWKGDKLCSGCRQVQYCSEKHQDMSWRSGHKIACQQIDVSSHVCVPNKNGTTSLECHKVGSNNAWPEFDIIIEEISEYDRDISLDSFFPESFLDSLQGDDYDDARNMVYFNMSISRAPEQLLRYYRNTKATPIWPVLSGRPSNADIPNCSYCGGPMCCEFQILPSLPHFCDVVDSLCEASCEASLPYKQEYAWVQLSSDC